ncbi:MAG: fimbrillin family protein [Bacteroidaceae bacterium]
MKRGTTTKTAIILTMAAILSACNADGIGDFTSARRHNTVIEGYCPAPASEDPETRTAVDPTEYTSGEIGINWLPTDEIGVYGTRTANARFTNQSEQEIDKTSFAGSLQDGEAPLYVYYPYTATAGTDPTAVKGNLPLTQHYSTATRELEGDWKVGVPQAGSTQKFTFEHIFAFLKFDINAGGTDVAGERLLSVSLTIPGSQLGGDFTCDLTTRATTFTPASDASCVTMEWTDQPELTASTFNGYMSVAPVTGIARKEATVQIKTDLHIVTFTETMKADAFRPNTYYTVPLTLSRFKDRWTMEDNPDAKEENADWVPGLQSRLACANTVFAIEGQPFMHKIRVPQSTSQTAHAVVPVKTGVKHAYNLPEGLTWNSERCLVQGTAPAAGDYVYSVEFEIGGMTYKEGINLHVAAKASDLHQPTPHMGWQSWNVLETKIDESSIKAVADALVSGGWADAGYKWLGIDDCWQKTDGTRDNNGVPVVNPTKFPNGLKSVTDYIHSKGLKAGIYSDCGSLTCASGSQGGGTLLGAYGYESQTAQAFTEWGFDKLKEDWFWGGHGDDDGKLDASNYDLARELYGRMGSGIKDAGNKILLSMCEWGTHDPWKWAAEAGGSSWRMSYDHRDGWMGQNGTTGTIIKKPKPNDPTVNTGGIGLKNVIDLMRNLWPYVGINRFNDADMLVVGIRGGGTSSNDLLYSDKGSMGDAEYETEFAMWCMWSSPLLLTLDVRNSGINSHDLALVKNAELIAINQDPLGQGAEYIKSVNGIDYYQKDLANGDVAIAAVNLSDNSADCTISLSDYEALDKAASYSARDLLGLKDAGTLSASEPLTATIAKHGTFIVRLTRK